MTLEELWELFPIFLVAHDDWRKDSFNDIEKTLTGFLSGLPVDRISHIGSITIQGIWAKNIIDVMIEIPESNDMKNIARILEKNGLAVMSLEESRILLHKVITHMEKSTID